MINTPRDGAESWTKNMPAPSNFDAAAYQKLIDNIVGTRDGRSIIKLAWAPAEFRWWPHVHGTESPGYVFPIFHAYTDDEGNLVAAPRWVLLERIEPEQFAPTPQFWESRRYNYDHGTLWDMTGPCPSEKYIELRCHSYHDGLCCQCLGGTCTCGIEYAHCWGQYAEPNERLLNWIRQKHWESLRDSDVQPASDIRYFAAPQGQQETVNTLTKAQEIQQLRRVEYNNYMLHHWERKPHSTSGRSESGLYLLD